MSDKKAYVMHANTRARENAQKHLAQLAEGWSVTFAPPKKSRDQEAFYHSIFAEVAAVVPFMGAKHDAETWKRLLVDAFARYRKDDGRPLDGYGQVIPALDMRNFIQLGFQTRHFKKADASEFIDFLLAWCSDQGLEFNVAGEVLE